MTLIRASQPEVQPAFQVKSYRSKEELAMRDGMETFIRARWPTARVVHEIVVGRGEARADMAVVLPDHFIAFEIKSGYDTTTRLMQQVCMFRLVAPELWVVTASRHMEDIAVAQYLIPTMGVIEYSQAAQGYTDELTSGPEVRTEAGRFEPHQESMLRVLWVAELHAEALRHRLASGAKPPTHDRLVKLMMKLTPAERMRSVCRQLRMRDAMWRADPPLSQEAA